jgi:hypothetical protein
VNVGWGVPQLECLEASPAQQGLVERGEFAKVARELVLSVSLLLLRTSHLALSVLTDSFVGCPVHFLAVAAAVIGTHLSEVNWISNPYLLFHQQLKNLRSHHIDGIVRRVSLPRRTGHRCGILFASAERSWLPKVCSSWPQRAGRSMQWPFQSRSRITVKGE